MPIYSYLCDEGHEFDRYLKLDDYKEPQVCDCGKAAKKQIKPTMINFDIAPWDAYVSPASGKTITSYKERNADMKATGSADYDPGIRKDNEVRRKRQDAKMDKAVDETVERSFESMSSKKKERLINEMAVSDIEYTRK